MWYSLPKGYISMPSKRSLPSYEQINKPLWHNPLEPKQIEHHCPQLINYRTMQERWSKNSPHLLHMQHQSKTIYLSSRECQGINFPQRSCPRKEGHLRWDFQTPQQFPQEIRAIRSRQGVIVTTNIKIPTLGKSPTRSIHTLAPDRLGIDKIQKSNQRLQLPILDQSRKMNILMES